MIVKNSYIRAVIKKRTEINSNCILYVVKSPSWGKSFFPPLPFCVSCKGSAYV